MAVPLRVETPGGGSRELRGFVNTPSEKISLQTGSATPQVLDLTDMGNRDPTQTAPLPPSTATLSGFPARETTMSTRQQDQLRSDPRVCLEAPSNSFARGRRSVQGSKRGQIERRKTMTKIKSLVRIGLVRTLAGHGKDKRSLGRRRGETSDLAEMGVAQMASLVVSHVLAPVWSVGLRSKDIPQDRIDWDSKAVRRFAADLGGGGPKLDPSAFWFHGVCQTIEKSSELATVYIILNLSLLEHLERLKAGMQTDSNTFDALRQWLSEQCAKLPGKYGQQERWNDELYADHRHRSLLHMGGKPLSDLGAETKFARESELTDELTQIRHVILESLLLASSYCRFNYRDEGLIYVCHELKEQVFLIAPGEELRVLCCGEKGPVYLSKYLRFLAITTYTASSCEEDVHKFLAGLVPGPLAQGVPHMVQDAALPVLLSLFNLAHSGARAGEYLVGACATAIRELLKDVDECESKIATIDTWLDSALKERQRVAEEERKERLAQAPVLAGIRVPARLLTAAPRKLVGFVEDLGRKAGKALAVIETKPDESRRPPDSRSLRYKVATLKGRLPGLLCVCKLLLQRLHNHGSTEAAKAWGTLISACKPLLQYPGPTGRLASDVLRCATAAVQSMDCLLRYRFSRAFVGGHDMETFRRDTIRLMFSPTECSGTSLSRVFLGRVKCSRPGGHRGLLLHLPLRSFGEPDTSSETPRADLLAMHKDLGIERVTSSVRFADAAAPGNRQSLVTTSIQSASSGEKQMQQGGTLCDEIAAAASLVLNVFLRVAEAEQDAEADRREGRPPVGAALDPPLDMGPDGLVSAIRGTPAYVLARQFPVVYRLLRGPLGVSGLLMTFSEGSGKCLTAVPSLYQQLGDVIRKMLEDVHADPPRGADALVRQPPTHHVSPCCPMLDVAIKPVSPDVLTLEEHSLAWCEALLQVAKDHWQCRQTGPATATEMLHPEAGDEGRVSKSAELDDIRIALCGGNGTVLHFCNGLAKFAQKHSEQSFKVYPLPIGAESMLTQFLERHDPAYFQFVSWPLGRCIPESFGHSFEHGWDDFVRRLGDSSEAESWEAALLRSAIDTYCSDADKCHRVYVYKLEAWRAKKPVAGALNTPQNERASQPGTTNTSQCSQEGSGPTVLAWCQQIELGPSTGAGDSYGCRPDPGRSPRFGLGHSPSMGSFSYPDELDAPGTPPTAWNPVATGPRGTTLQPGVSQGSQRRPPSVPPGSHPRRRATSVHRGRGGSGTGRDPMVQIGRGASSTHKSVDELAAMMRGGVEGVERLQNMDPPPELRAGASTGCVCTTGSAIIEWMLRNLKSHLTVSPRDDAVRVAQKLADAGVLVMISAGATGGDMTYQDFHTAWYRINQPHPDADLKLEGAPPTTVARRSTVTSPNPLHLRVAYVPMVGGRRYPELQQEKSGKDMWLHKMSIRNIGNTGDMGLRPDPTNPELQVYLLRDYPRNRKMVLPGEGSHYSIHGALSIEAVGGDSAAPAAKDRRGHPPQQQDGASEGFRIMVDGTVMGPFMKIRISPWLIKHPSSEGRYTHEHLNFHIMSFCPFTNT
eukprot:TRINITY_DN12019_c0_g1_i1.p1 TRINITY_DN12019_c0_g1~~TRINITY_DN12019_c0_g1_i1.p1  ORF type:complete len:1549 (+),score=443.22 TRINITY_DN12019_c0_g1_i1:68-4714(+)